MCALTPMLMFLWQSMYVYEKMYVNALETLTLCLRCALVHPPGIVDKCISKIPIYIFPWKHTDEADTHVAG